MSQKLEKWVFVCVCTHILEAEYIFGDLAS